MLPTMEALLVILLVLAVYRTTRVITRDKLPLIDLPREAFVQRWGAFADTPRERDDQRRNRVVRTWRYFFAGEWASIDGTHRTNLVMKSLAYLWECDWCMSIWVGAGMVYGLTFFVNTPYPWLLWLASSAMTGLLTNLEERLEKTS